MLFGPLTSTLTFKGTVYGGVTSTVQHWFEIEFMDNTLKVLNKKNINGNFGPRPDGGYYSWQHGNYCEIKMLNGQPYLRFTSWAYLGNVDRYWNVVGTGNSTLDNFIIVKTSELTDPEEATITIEETTADQDRITALETGMDTKVNFAYYSNMDNMIEDINNIKQNTFVVCTGGPEPDTDSITFHHTIARSITFGVNKYQHDYIWTRFMNGSWTNPSPWRKIPVLTAATDTEPANLILDGNIIVNNVATGPREIRFQAGGNDYARFAGGATGSNAGYLEIATADDASEPIYVRQYKGVFTSDPQRTLLLDES